METWKPRSSRIAPSHTTARVSFPQMLSLVYRFVSLPFFLPLTNSRVQWTKTDAYIQVVGFINNTGIGLDPSDQGGELDPHGADLQGNPLGGVVFSNGTADSDGTTLTQVFNWNT